MSTELKPGVTREALERWSAQHGISAWLNAPLSALIPTYRYYNQPWVNWLRRSGGGLTWGEAALMPAARTNAGARGQIAPGAQEALFMRLNAAAVLSRHGLAEEAARSRAPLSGHLGRLQQRLEGLKAAFVAEGISPLPDDQQPQTRYSIDQENMTLLLQHRGSAHCLGHLPASPTLRLSLKGPVERALSCDCKAKLEGRCPLGFTVLNRTLDLLTSDVGERLEALLAVPQWERILNRVDAALALPGDADAQGRETGWWLTADARSPLSLQPVVMRPLKTRDGWRFSNTGLEAIVQGTAPGLHEADRAVAQRLLAGEQTFRRYTDQEQSHTFDALALLAGHPRVFLGGGKARVDVRRVTPSLRWDMADGEVSVRLLIDGEPRDVAALAKARSCSGMYVNLDERSRCEVMTLPPGAQVLIEALCHGSPFPGEAADALMARLAAVEALLPVAVDEALRGEEVPPNDWPVVRLKQLDDGTLEVAFRIEPLPEVGLQIPGEGPTLFHGLQDDQRVYAVRDLDEERDQLTADIAELGCPEGEPLRPFTWVLEDSAAVVALLEALERHDDLFEVEWDGQPIHLTRYASASDLKITVGMQKDWFGIQGSLEVDGVSVSLLALFAAAREGRDIIEVGSGAWVRLTQAFREQLNAASAAVFESKGGRMEVSPLNVPAVASLAEHGAEVDAPLQWTAVLQRIRESATLDTRPPAGLTATLRPYQQEGWGWLARLTHWSPGGCLADDMGLGKTVQALALLLHRQQRGPALVVGPTSVGFNWLREAQRFAPALKAALYRDSDRQSLLKGVGPGDLLITSYDLMTRDRAALEAVRFGTVIFDEAQALKNAQTKRARAARALDTDAWIALTGTPVENRTSELWSLFNVITPGLLGSWDRFRERFAKPIEAHDDDDARQALASQIRPFLLRRTKAEVAPDLPPRHEIREDIELSRQERRLYEQVRLEAIARLAGGGDGVSEQQRRFQVLAAITKLRQLACHPKLVKARSRVASSKLERLRELVQELRSEGHRALIFSQFTRHLGLAREALEADGVSLRYLDGSTPAAKRRAEVDAFQSGEGDVFLISLKAGGTGLNLTAANYVIHLDPWWNPAVEDQATDRAHRIGQSRAVTVYRLIAADTIEESILEMHAEKRALVEGLLAGTGKAAALSVSELLAMLGAA